MPEVLQNNPIIIVVIVLVLVLLIAIPVLIRRRRAGADEVTPPIDVDSAMRDYTSGQYEEPPGFADRFRSLSIGAKLLIFLVPLVLIVAGVIAVMTLSPTTDGNQPPPPPPPEITNVKANVASASKIVVTADTNLADGTEVTALLKEGDQDFAWFDPATATGRASNRKVQVTLEKLDTGPTPKQDQQYQVVLVTTANGQAYTSEPADLEVPSVYSAAFYHLASATQADRPTPTPTAAPSPSTPTAIPPSSPAAAEPTATPTISLTASVFNGGNIRQQPRIEPCNCPQLHAGEIVQLLEKTADGRWYRVSAPEGTGWVSVTLLRIDAQVADQVPIEGQQTPPVPVPGGTPEATPSGLTASVRNGGNVRERPVTGQPLDQINAGETVQLLEKTADGVWYRLTTPRGITGWVHVSLLTIDREVARQVPVAR